MTTFGDKLKSIRTERNMSQEDMGKLLGTSKQVISRYETNQRTPKITIVEEYAKKLGVPLNYLADNSVSAIKEEGAGSYLANPIEYSELAQIPIIGRISCGNGSLAYSDIEGHEPTPTEWIRGGDYFYLRARGDSMINARIMDGDLVLIREQNDVENGEIAAVLIDDETFLKRVFKNNGTLVLQSENPNYSPIICSNKTNGCIKIIGKLKKIIINA